ncbi:2-oxoglutarate-dependent dioxygenase 19 isoform X2 [Nicotiana tabacum]|uniref:2-oxoglutarate-dependent dioxygenase 19 isoform X2 n=1 Tax=Nicotiana tabacum TaxID=4097 RepID=A0A1S4BV52_TOBAC|nr:protein DMR6-LIKE OXYGENASE 2-like isoform X2 [Nicotiana tomentosiformis]XP_016492756.1 PREDICTED: protein DMR6-LIKE OXYGENASE 2-like isoform X2 [Nicotiana tabacum]
METTAAPLLQTPNYIKQLAESPDLHFIPANYVHSTNNPCDSSDSNSIPIIDFSLLTSGDPHQCSIAIHHLSKACQDWGFFMVVNHGIPENLIKAVIDCTHEFFNLPEEDKREYAGKHVLDPIRCGTSFNASKENVFFWRDYLKVFVHPQFHSPTKPQGYRDIVSEYCEKIREVAKMLLGGISESLGLEEGFLDKALDLKSGLQIFVGNYYPNCPQPELTMGMPPHSDHGLLTLLIQNQVGGLQVQHEGKWINVNALPNSLLIFSNGKYKSNMHRAVVNNKVTRISIATAHGPSLETIVSPASPLVYNENSAAAYIPMKYSEYLELQQSNQLDGKSCLERLKFPRN